MEMGKIEQLLKQGFKFNKALGQNFVSDTNLLCAIVADAGIKSEDTVIEIGTGAGTLTAELAQKASRVITYEADKKLLPFLNDSLKEYPHVDIRMADILEVPHSELTELGRFKVVANLPYYITTPIIFYFLESALDLESITVMVQREVAQRITAKRGTKDYGALTLAVAARCEARITRTVSRAVFTPAPNVDSAVVRLDVVRPFDAALSRLIKCLFSMRRKTAVNNLTAGFGLSRGRCLEILSKLRINENARGEELSIEQVRAVSEALK